jgi:hypothetical protein
VSFSDWFLSSLIPISPWLTLALILSLTRGLLNSTLHGL